MATSSVSRDFYLDLAEPFVRIASTYQADTGAILDPYWPGGEWATATSRYVASVSLLTSAGRCLDLVQSAALSMDYRCEQLRQSSITKERLVGPDFETRDLMLGLRYLSSRVGAGRVAAWRNALGDFDPETVYVNVLSQCPGDKIFNWNVYALCGEWLKVRDHVADNREWIEQYMPLQLRRFNGWGLYRDPGCPITYDLTVRQNFSWILANGYDGAYREGLEEILRRGGLSTLAFMSPLGQTPYGGRSNQYHHNEAMAACICEYEASRYQIKGSYGLAGAFKRQARLCALATAPWILDMDPPRHLKNQYVPGTEFGCDPYGHYAAYALLTSSLFGLAWLLADEAIQEYPTPAECGGVLLHLPEASSDLGGFHKIFASCGGYHLELDTCGQKGYDATGLGRLHRQGIPSWIALSCPAAAMPQYTVIQSSQEKGFAGSAAWMDAAGVWHRVTELAEGDAQTTMIASSATSGLVWFEISHEIAGDLRLVERYEVSPMGVIVEVTANGGIARLGYDMPFLLFDGSQWAKLKPGERHLMIQKDDGTFLVQALNEGMRILCSDARFECRNGILGLCRAEGASQHARIRLSLSLSTPGS